jgi:hypothetical protein
MPLDLLISMARIGHPLRKARAAVHCCPSFAAALAPVFMSSLSRPADSISAVALALGMGPLALDAGQHELVVTNHTGETTVIWAPALDRGFSPYAQSDLPATD